MPCQRARRLHPLVGLTLALTLVAGACAPDSDGTEDVADTGVTEPATAPDADGPATEAGIAEDCPPAGADEVSVAPAWPGPALHMSTDDPPLEIDLAEAIEADCVVLASTYSAALPAPTPSLGTVEPVDGFVVRYHPRPAPDDPDDPQVPWWGQDRIRACILVEGGRTMCLNIDVEVLRPDVIALAEGLGVDSLPYTLSPLERSDPNGGGLSPAGLARLQDALAGEWALALITSTIDRSEAPAALAAACESEGNELDELWDRGRALIDEHAALSDLRSLELATATGQEPSPDLSAEANALLVAAEDWVRCRR